MPFTCYSVLRGWSLRLRHPTCGLIGGCQMASEAMEHSAGGECVTLYFKKSFDFGRFSYCFILYRFEFSWYVNYYQIASRDMKRKKWVRKNWQTWYLLVLCSLLPASQGLNSMACGIGGKHGSQNAAALLEWRKRRQNFTPKARRSPTSLCN